MSSALVSNPVTNSDRSRDYSKKKRKKKSPQNKEEEKHIKWKSEAQQQIYSSKLIQALNRVNISDGGDGGSSGGSTSGSAEVAPPPPSVPRRGRAVREAADRVLAVAAKGRTRWSRAILTKRIKLKFRKQKRARLPAVATESSRSRKPRFSVWKLKGKGLPTVQRKVRVLGRLVPGCRKQPLPVILEEATDYIAALEMQVRAMSALADLLSGGSSSGSDAAPPPAG